MIDDYETLRPNRVKHIPLAPPRPCTPGEGIYLKLWQEWAEANPGEWRRLFTTTTHRPRQRAASVAASFMVFMGCNGGRGFTGMAEQFAKSGFFLFPERAYIAAWAIDNQRHRGVNSGLRISEYMLAAEHPIVGRLFGSGVEWDRVPAITQDDNDYLESMVRWWSTEAAKDIRAVAEPAIQAEQRRMWARARFEHDAQMVTPA